MNCSGRLYRLFGSLLISACASTSQTGEIHQQPETATGFRELGESRAKNFMASTANPAATAAAVEILAAGGSAVDAAIAAQLVLGVTEPQSSGLGGGLFLLHFDGKTGTMLGYDGREQAPKAMGPEAFLEPSGKPREFFDALRGGLAVGVPGVVAALERAHQAHGVLPWKRLFDPAIELARDGWRVHARLANALTSVPDLAIYAGDGSMYFGPDGAPRKAGEQVTNPELAESMALVAEFGSEVFYRGELAKKIVDVVADADNPGLLSLSDLDSYRAVVRDPHCVDYRGYKVCGFSPPAGSVVALTILEILEPFDLGSMVPGGVEFMHIYSQASDMAYADRDRYYADPDVSTVPVERLLAPERLTSGSATIELGPRDPSPLSLPEVDIERRSHPVCSATAGLDVPSFDLPSTTHVSIMDAAGNVVSMTSSVEFNFGSSTMAGGFILNNQLTDFEFTPCADGRLRANAAEGGKRPRSSMSPVIIFDSQGKPVFALGSPGGAAIISYTAQTIIGLIDWKLDPQEAVALPHVIGRKGATMVEQHPSLAVDAVERLSALGHDVSVKPMTSGLSVVQRLDDGFAGGADPRRDGIAAGR